MKFSTRLKQWRKARSLTRATAAKKLKIKARTLEGWEQDRRVPASYVIEALMLKMSKV